MSEKNKKDLPKSYQQADIFQRISLLLGEDFYEIFSTKKVIIFGLGGVGSWCAEALIRSGIGQITLVDYDKVVTSNINRQLPANTETIGAYKVEVLKSHFEKINPHVLIDISKQAYTQESSADFHLEEYDYIIDAIDSVKDKIHLIQTACKTNATLFSSMGAALRIDPTRVRVSEFWKVQGDPLARALRQQFKKTEFPTRKFQCVYSDERLKNKTEGDANGSMMPVTATFGMVLASLVIKDVTT